MDNEERMDIINAEAADTDAADTEVDYGRFDHTGVMKTGKKPLKDMEAYDALISSLREKELPDEGTPDRELPIDGMTQNQVMFGNTLIEIKPTKMKYQRTRTAAFYTALENYALTDILSIDKGFFDEERDGDKCVYDWLVAATDDPELVRREYNNIDNEVVEKVLEIFLRVNRILEKREALKKNMIGRGVR